MIKFDMKSGYHHLDIFGQHQQYLGFSWKINATTRYFKFTVLPFGLSTACSIFTKFLKPLLRHWRSKGYLAILYLDDGLITSSCYNELCRISNTVRRDLSNAGIIVSETKCQWEPISQLDYLGITVNLQEFNLAVPTFKRLSIIDLLSETIDRPTV